MDRAALDAWFAEADDVLTDWHPSGDAMVARVPETDDVDALPGDSYYEQWEPRATTEHGTDWVTVGLTGLPPLPWQSDSSVRRYVTPQHVESHLAAWREAAARYAEVVRGMTESFVPWSMSDEQIVLLRNSFMTFPAAEFRQERLDGWVDATPTAADLMERRRNRNHGPDPYRWDRQRNRR